MTEKMRSYTQGFKDSAIQLVLNNDQSAKNVAKGLEMSDKTLYAWVGEYKRAHNLTIGTRSPTT